MPVPARAVGARGRPGRDGVLPGAVPVPAVAAPLATASARAAARATAVAAAPARAPTVTRERDDDPVLTWWCWVLGHRWRKMIRGRHEPWVVIGPACGWRREWWCDRCYTRVPIDAPMIPPRWGAAPRWTGPPPARWPWRLDASHDR